LSNSSLLGDCPMMTSLSYTWSCPFLSSWTESEAKRRMSEAVLCCAVKFSAMGSGRLYHLFWLDLSMMIGRSFFFDDDHLAWLV
jgi:hypothetical protein